MSIRLFTGICLVAVLASVNTPASAENTRRMARAAPDNTGRNVRDKDMSTTKTPEDQGKSKTDLNITSPLRKALVNDQTLSVNSENIKIITNNGIVTLRGPVESASEREKVKTMAERTQGVVWVDNQLEVKTK